MNVNVRHLTTGQAAKANRRARFMRQLRQWHWISAAVSLLGTLMFAITGITLNHAGQIEAKPQVRIEERQLPQPLLDAAKTAKGETGTKLPARLAAWLEDELSVTATDTRPEWSDEEIYVSLPRPGGDAWVSLDRETGAVRYEVTNRGWVSYLNDLHKGRNTGFGWSLFIDGFAIACIVFAATGLALLQIYASNRPMTWPLVGFGCAAAHPDCHVPDPLRVMMRVFVPLGLSTLIASPALAVEVTLKVDVPQLDVAEYHRPYIAIWIERLTRSSAIWRSGTSQEPQERRRQVAQGHAAMVAPDRPRAAMPVDGISGATRPPGSHVAELQRTQ